MKRFNDYTYGILMAAIFVIIMVGLFIWNGSASANNQVPTQEVTLEYNYDSQFGGASPVKVYQIYDKDTGVYYAVTEKGGICVMETMDEGVKLVDQGNGEIIHHNKSH